MDLDVSHFELTNGTQLENKVELNASPAKEEYKKELAYTLTGKPASNRVLAFQQRPRVPTLVERASLRVLFNQNKEAGLLPRKYSRHIPQAPERILDAPELLDDYCANGGIQPASEAPVLPCPIAASIGRARSQ
jgi:cell division cycle protein 20 (cofactor of APC complex)